MEGWREDYGKGKKNEEERERVESCWRVHKYGEATHRSIAPEGE